MQHVLAVHDTRFYVLAMFCEVGCVSNIHQTFSARHYREYLCRNTVCQKKRIDRLKVAVSNGGLVLSFVIFLCSFD